MSFPTGTVYFRAPARGEPPERCGLVRQLRPQLDARCSTRLHRRSGTQALSADAVRKQRVLLGKWHGLLLQFVENRRTDKQLPQDPNLPG